MVYWRSTCIMLLLLVGSMGSFPSQVRGLSFQDTRSPRYFPETGHSIRGEFRLFWETKGGLELFGYPLTEEFRQTLENNTEYTVQYYERARFEFHPDLPAGKQVVLGHLGRSMAPPDMVAPIPPHSSSPETTSVPPIPTATPVPPTATPVPPTATPVPPTPTVEQVAGNTVAILGPAEDGSQKIGSGGGGAPLMPAEERISIEPREGPRGTTFQFTLTDLEPRRVYTLEIWRSCTEREEVECTERITRIILDPTDRNGETRYLLRTFEEDIPGYYRVKFSDDGKSRGFKLEE